MLAQIALPSLGFNLADYLPSLYSVLGSLIGLVVGGMLSFYVVRRGLLWLGVIDAPVDDSDLRYEAAWNSLYESWRRDGWDGVSVRKITSYDMSHFKRHNVSVAAPGFKRGGYYKASEYIRDEYNSYVKRQKPFKRYSNKSYSNSRRGKSSYRRKGSYRRSRS